MRFHPWRRGLLTGLIGLVAAACATTPTPPATLPFATLDAAPVTRSEILQCADGTLLVHGEIAAPGGDALTYRVLYAPTTRRVLVFDYSRSPTDATTWRVLVGTAEGETHTLVLTATWTIPEAQSRIPDLCAWAAGTDGPVSL